VTRKPPPSAEVRDLRELLAVVLDALTLDYAVDGYDERIKERASTAKIVLRDILNGGDGRIGWNADWLRSKLREEEARHGGGGQQ
jgi:hypothetical protein